MISQNSLQLIEALLSFGPEGAYREALVQRANVSTATFYRALNPLLKLGIIVERASSTYVLPLDHPHNFAFKLWHDQRRLLELDPGPRDDVYRLLREIQSQQEENLLALWLHGSTAQNTLSRHSDVDFLAVLRKEQSVELSGAREVQVTVLSDKRFRADFRAGDPFIRTILTHGILLFDRDYAKFFYSQPLATLSPGSQKERAEMQGDLQNRVLFSIREQDTVNGADALSSFAVAVSRSMLEELGQLPAGKSDLIEKVRFYFGQGLAGLIWECLEKRAPIDRWLQIQDDLSFWQQRFAKHSAAIFRVLDGLSGAYLQVEEVIGEMLRGLVQGELRKIDRPGDAVDFVLESECMDRSVLFIVKSLKTRLSPMQVRHAAHSDRSGMAVIIVNQLKDVPLVERTPLTDKQIFEASLSGVALVDAVELFQAWMSKSLSIDSKPLDLLHLIKERYHRSDGVLTYKHGGEVCTPID